MIVIDLVPNLRIGPFKLGTSIKVYSNLPLLYIDTYNNIAESYKVYNLDGQELRLYFENDILVSIGCYDQCIFNTKNLIGMSINELKKIFKYTPTKRTRESLGDGIRYIYEYDEQGLLFYMKKNKIVLVSWY